MEASPCKHFQTGYCKFRKQCRNKHIVEMCQTEHCASESCIKRHPKVCRYFSTFCKFGDNCRYKHVTPQSNTLTNTIHLVAQLNRPHRTELCLCGSVWSAPGSGQLDTRGLVPAELAHSWRQHHLAILPVSL